MNIIDQKLIEAWTILTLSKDITDKTIAEAMELAQVPEKYREQVEVKVAERTIEILSQTN